MEKVICDICGTIYPESEECCPVCGSFQDLEFNFELEMEDDDFLKDSPITASKIQKQEEALEAFLEEPEEEEDLDEEDDEEEEEEEEHRRGKTGVVILLIVLIMVLLAACGFLFLRYVMPNLNTEDLIPKETQTQTEAPVETTTEPGIPCQQLILTSGGTVELTREGEYKLINVIVKPEDTTDKLSYSSSDEAVVTVNEEGRITAVAEGEAVVSIVCGEQKIDCRVKVGFVEETEPATEETTVPVAEETEGAAETQTEEAEETQATTETEETQPAQTVPETQAQLKDVTLKLKKNDFSMGVGYQYTIPLDCDLEYSEIEWSTGNAGIAVIKDGVISTLSKGTTQFFAKYGDQTVSGWIRVK